MPRRIGGRISLVLRQFHAQLAIDCACPSYPASHILGNLPIKCELCRHISALKYWCGSEAMVETERRCPTDCEPCKDRRPYTTLRQGHFSDEGQTKRRREKAENALLSLLRHPGLDPGSRFFIFYTRAPSQKHRQESGIPDQVRDDVGGGRTTVLIPALPSPPEKAGLPRDLRDFRERPDRSSTERPSAQASQVTA